MTHTLFTYLVTHAHAKVNYNFEEFEGGKDAFGVMVEVWALDKDYRRH